MVIFLNGCSNNLEIGLFYWAEHKLKPVWWSIPKTSRSMVCLINLWIHFNNPRPFSTETLKASRISCLPSHGWPLVIRFLTISLNIRNQTSKFTHHQGLLRKIVCVRVLTRPCFPFCQKPLRARLRTPQNTKQCCVYYINSFTYIA